MDNLSRIHQLTNEVDELLNFKHKIIGAINTSHEGIAILDENGIYTYVNESHNKMFGYHDNELIGKSWSVLYSQNDIEWFTKNVFPEIEKNGKWSGEAKAICKDGKTIVHEMVYLTSLPDGGLICTCRDRSYEINKWELLIDKLPFGVCIAGIDGYFKHVNIALINMLGYTETELLLKPFIDLIVEEDLAETYQKIGELSTMKPVIGFTNRYIKKNGEIIKLEWTSTANSDGQIFAVVKQIIN